MSSRGFTAWLLLAALVTGGAWLLVGGADHAPTPAATASTGILTVPVLVVGPDGSTLWNDTITIAAHNATALTALLLAGEAAGWTVDVAQYPGYGACGAYVREAAGLREHRDGTGWEYHTRPTGDRDDDAEADWAWGSQSAACWPLTEGDALRWRFVA